MKRTIADFSINKQSTIFRNDNSYTINPDDISEDSPERKYSKNDRYIYGNNTDTNLKNNPLNSILEKFPEYNAGKSVIITNTGLICFNDGNKTIIYDLIEKEDNNDISSIGFGTESQQDFNEQNNPLSVRHFYYYKDDDKILFKPNHRYDQSHIEFDADYIDDSDNNNGIFNYDKASINSLEFDFRQCFIFKFNNNMSEDNVTIYLDNNSQSVNLGSNKIKTENNSIIVDLSNYINVKKVKFSFVTSDTITETQELEVIC